MTDLHVSACGARTPRPARQVEVFAEFLELLRPDVLHHGDCTGADEEAFSVARDMGIRTVAHPPSCGTWRAYTESDEILPAKGFLERDRDIVNAGAALLAMPAGRTPGPHSGTWYTISYCLSRVTWRPVYYAWPDGTADWPRIGSGNL